MSRSLPCLCLALACACSSGGAGGADSGAADTPSDPGVLEDTFDPAEPGSDAATEVAEPPAVRLLRATEPSHLVGGPFAGGAVGDYVLENSRARFVVRGGPEPAFWGPWGGNVIDADVRRAPGEAGHDLLGELIPIFGLMRTFRPASFEVVDDGADGAAVLRVTGTDAGIPIIDSAVPTRAQHLAITLEYRLAPDQPWLEIRSRVTNPGPEAATVMTGAVPMWQDRLVKYYDGLALEGDAPPVKSNLPAVHALAPDVAYALVAGAGQALSAPVNIQDVEVLQIAKPTLAAGETDERALFLVVSDGDAHALADAAAVLRGAIRPVRLAGGLDGLPPEVPARDVLVRALDAGGRTRAAVAPAADRSFVVQLPDDATALEVRVAALGQRQVPVPNATDGPVRLPAPGAAVLEIRCHPTDDADVDLPCRALLQPGPAAAPDAAGVAELYAGPGRHRFAVPAGAWTVTLSRGFEYELDRHDVTLAEGAEATVTGTLERSVDTSGWVATTVHVHSELSMDSDLPLDLRLYALAASGMEYVYPTEHDVCADYQPFVEELGLDAWLASDVGCEISPMPGHFNCLGCTPTTAAFAVPFVTYDDDGALEAVLTAPELWQRMRDTLQATLIQINHPFSTQAFFASLGLSGGDPLGPLLGPKLSLEFDTIELHNSHDDASDIYGETLPTWYRMLNDGIRRTGVGAEDTHQARGTGTPRTLVAAPDAGFGRRTGDDARVGLPTLVASALRDGRAVSVQGPFPELWLDGQPIGATVTPQGGEITVRVRVQAPTWMHLGSARLLRNGEVVETFDLGGAGPATRLDVTFSRPEAGPAWYLLLVEGDAHPLRPLHGETALSITNPVFVGPE